MNMLKNKRGFTLVELVIIIAIAGIVLTPISLIVTSSLRNAEDIHTQITAEQDVHQTFIVLNEALRKNGFSQVAIITNYHGYGKALKVNQNIYFLKGNQFIKQDYDVNHEVTTSEIVLSNYIHSLEYNLSERLLEIILHVDMDNDGTIDDTYPFEYGIRD